MAGVIGRPNNSTRPRGPKTHPCSMPPALKANARGRFLTCVRIRIRRWR
jgi:hypothetical protein